MTPRMVGCRAAARESLQKCGSRLKRARPPPHAAARAIMSAMVRSFYFRIGFSFVVFVVAVLLAQNAMFSYMLFPNRVSAAGPSAEQRRRHRLCRYRIDAR